MPTPQNGQRHSDISSAIADELFECDHFTEEICNGRLHFLCSGWCLKGLSFTSICFVMVKKIQCFITFDVSQSDVKKDLNIIFLFSCRSTLWKLGEKGSLLFVTNLQGKTFQTIVTNLQGKTFRTIQHVFSTSRVRSI